MKTMAPTLSRTHAGGPALAVAPNMTATNVNANSSSNNNNNNTCSAHVTPQHRHTVSITHTKGLLNAPGQNNCFLNSAVQVLWHLDIFRRSFRELSGHACMADSCIFCALKELFAQFQYSHESALPPDALRRALAETFFNQQRFQLGFMDDAAECFENILLRIHFHIANNESEDMCNAVHCIPHQKFAMTLVEQGVCHACRATSEPLPFTQMVHYVTSSTLCSQAKLSRENGDASFLQDFGKLLRKAGGMGEIRDCPSACGAKIQIQRTLMNHPEIMSIGIVWDSERPTLDHIMDVFQAIGSTIHLRDVFHTVVDDRWAASAEHQLVGVVTYYGKHYSTFFFHTKLRVWIYFDDATVREIGPRWEQVVEKCRRGHFQPLLLLYANPHGSPVITESAPKTVVYSRASHLGPEYPACRAMEMASANRSAFVSPLRRAMTPNPEKQQDAYTDVIPRRAITPNPEVYYRQELQGNSNYQPDRSHYWSNGNGVAYNVNHRVENGVPPMNNLHRIVGRPAYPMPVSKPVHDHVHSVNGASNLKGHNPETINSIYNMELLQHLLQNKCSVSSGPVQNGHGNRGGGGGGLFDGNGPLRTNGYFNNCDVIDGDKVNHQVSANQFRRPVGDISALAPKDANNDMIYISRKAVENVLNYQKLQRHRSNSENNDSAAGSRNSNSSLESFENAFRMRSHYNVNNVALETQRSETADVIGISSADAKRMSNVPRCRDSGNWSGDRNSSSSTSSNSVENPYFSVAGNKRVANGVLGSPVKGQLENGGHRATCDAGYDSFSLSSNDSFPMSHVKHHNQHLAQILENPNKQLGNGLNAMTSRLAKNQTELVDECHLLCLEADTFLEKSLENEKAGDLDAAISFCNGAAAKARAAMDAPYSNPQILAFARMKHNTCVMRTRTLHRRQLVRKDSISSHGSSTCTDLDSPQKSDGSSASTLGHHSRQSSRDSTRSRNGNHSRQSSRDGNHSRQGSKDSTLNGQQSNSSSDKKRIELYGTLPKRNSTKKTEKTADASFQYINGLANGVSAEVRPSKPKPVSIPIVRDTRIPRRISFRTSSSSLQQPQHLESMSSKHAPSNYNVDVCKKAPHPPPPTVDRDIKNMAEARQKSNLHRTNSIPSNFISKMEASAKKNASMDAILPATQPSDGSGGNAKVGKKQHKIRRKLLMGGLIRRKNRSMPDLREGQNQSQSLESNLRCYDDSSLQTAQLPSPAHMLDNRRNTSNLSCQDIYYASQNHHQHHHSSHGKIPPPPPVRTTSQLTSRSQSHGNLFNTQEQKKTAFAFPCPVVPYSGTVQSTKMSATARTTNVPVMAHSQLNEVTTLADVHHERTPSDNIRPVSLARTMSMRGLSSGHGHQRAMNSSMPRNEANLCASSSSSLSTQHIHCPQVDRVTPVLSKANQSGVADGRLNSGSIESTNSPVGGGSSLLEQLLSKRQQMLDNPSKASQETSLDSKTQLPKSEGWLQELQAKQQLMLIKKPVAQPTRSPPSNAQTNGLPTTIQAQSGIPSLDQQATRITNHSISKATGLQCKSRAATPSLIAVNDECATDGNYRPKSVRDLANRFEKILVSPPVATPSNDSAQVAAKNGLGEQTSIPQQQYQQQQQQQQQQLETQLQGSREQVRQMELETRISPSSEQRHQQYEQYNRVSDSRVVQMMSSPAVGNAQDSRNSSLLTERNISPSMSNCQQQIGLVNGVSAISRVQQQSDPGLRSVALIPPPYPGPYSAALPAPFAGTGPPSMARNGLPVVANSVPITKLPMGMCTETSKQQCPSVGQTDRTIQRKKGKKSVTFSDQIVLVACADDHEGFSLLNPLLEKVLHNKSISTNALKPQDLKPPPASNSNGGYYQLDKASNMESTYRQQTPVSNQYSMSSDRVPQKPLVCLPGNSFDFPSGLPARPPSVSATYHGLHKPTGNVATSTPEVPCYLCRKKTVIPPVVYCVDCEFYMSRFKPKN